MRIIEKGITTKWPTLPARATTFGIFLVVWRAKVGVHEIKPVVDMGKTKATENVVSFYTIVQSDSSWMSH